MPTYEIGSRQEQTRIKETMIASVHTDHPRVAMIVVAHNVAYGTQAPGHTMEAWVATYAKAYPAAFQQVYEDLTHAALMAVRSGTPSRRTI
jgi:hypothetical protein